MHLSKVEEGNMLKKKNKTGKTGIVKSLLQEKQT